jgi:undecaprenyl-diphosphatase
MGALASVAGLLPAAPRRVLRALAATLAVSRILLLAHWASDVVAGFAIGALIERLLRPVTLRSRQQSEAGEQ